MVIIQWLHQSEKSIGETLYYDVKYKENKNLIVRFVDIHSKDVGIQVMEELKSYKRRNGIQTRDLSLGCILCRCLRKLSTRVFEKIVIDKKDIVENLSFETQKEIVKERIKRMQRV